jgi:hypothetical protein
MAPQYSVLPEISSQAIFGIGNAWLSRIIMEKLRTSVSLPCNINTITKSPLQPTISGSCSVQSHLSNMHSKKRLRTTLAYEFTDAGRSSYNLEANVSSTSYFAVQYVVDYLLPFLHQSEDSHSLRLRPRRKGYWKWIGCIYSFLCVVFTTTQLLQGIQNSRLPSPPLMMSSAQSRVQCTMSNDIKFIDKSYRLLIIIACRQFGKFTANVQDNVHSSPATGLQSFHFLFDCPRRFYNGMPLVSR